MFKSNLIPVMQEILQQSNSVVTRYISPTSLGFRGSNAVFTQLKELICLSNEEKNYKHFSS